ncbi:amino acid adenylation domain-containing protein [Antrihabitans cavernicola]|uniref:Amino acid adenylation domain-containing protein n=1 Tax=Antrihabitans cavernicola TaxID=2495913 RepID=A0A5A7S6T1_9NOCA|nr:non-ribosomal peptide synthetase [Spelaeibacter cavernicola]KAA0021586.1 amino acid adenylation domain-containing protein [Spelaeibacter cavernicola]
MSTSDAGEGRARGGRERPAARGARRRRSGVLLLPQLLTAAVESAGDAPALVFQGRTVSYRELDASSSQLARVLIEDGVGPGSVVAVGLTRSLESVLSVWAVAKAGGAFVPVDPTYPADRIEHMIRDSGAALVLTVETHREALAAVVDSSVPLLVLDDADTRDRVENAPVAPITYRDRLRTLHPEDAAYVIYTSGSTGLPKGVVVTHTGLGGVSAAEREHYGVTSDSRVLHVCSPSFDVSVLELLLAFTAGACLVVAPATAFGGEELGELLAHERVTHVLITPGALATVDPGALPDLRVVVVAGDSFGPELVARWSPGRDFHNGYGPTEATILATSSAPLQPEQPITIGSAIPGVATLVLDHRLRPVPLGVSGELYLAGAQLARGYHGRWSLTAERFVANPFGDPGARMYRTGDLVRVSESEAGDASTRVIEYIGRNDFQVKVRGFRIELGEIDAALTAHDHVEFAVTIGHTSDIGAVSLVSYVVGPKGNSLDTDELTAFVSDALPRHMVPASIIVLDEVPLTPVGKLDRKALPEPVFASAAEFRAPRTPIEQTIADVFAEVLGVDQVGIDDSFFALGGDSIVSIQVVSRAKARGVVFTPRDVFEHRTVAGLAAVAESGDAAGAVTELVELSGGGVGWLPLLPFGRLMIERGGGYSRYNQTIPLELPVGIDRIGVVSTIAAVVDRHDALRSTLVHDDRGWGLEVADSSSVDVGPWVHRVELGDVDDAEFVTRASSELDAALGRLDPAAGVMVQFVWFDFGPSRSGRLLIVAHHLVVDGVSWRILVPDFVSAWAQVSAGGRPELAPVGTSLRRWAHGLVDEAAERTGELELWTSILDGPDPTLGARPFDGAIDTVATVERLDVTVPVDVTKKVLTVVPDRFYGGVNDGLVAGLALAVAKWRRDRGVSETSTLLQLEGHGREEGVVPGADLSRTVGWFTSVYPIRVDVGAIDLDDAFAGRGAAGAAVKAVKEQLLSVPDSGMGFGMLRFLNDDTASQLFGLPSGQISFNYLGRISSGDIPSGMEGVGWLPAGDMGDVSAPGDPDMPANKTVDINAIVTEGPDGAALRATFAYPVGAIDADDVQRLADLWVEALGAIATYTDTAQSGGRTPSDLLLANTSQSDIELWETQFPALTDVWPLSPLQSGLLFHAMLAATSVDVYTAQVVLTLEGAVDSDRLQTAGRAVLDRYPNLRTAFITDASGSAVQVVLDSVELPWTEVDLSTREDSKAEFERLLVDDRKTRFDLARPPLMRFTLVSLGDGDHRLVVTNHHILLDGWSMPLLMKDLLVLYATSGDTSILPPVRPYRSYLAWLGEQDIDSSVQRWATELAGVSEPTTLAPVVPGREITTLSGEYTFDISADATARLTAFAADLGVTVNTVVQVVWGILLGRSIGRDDVVFGATVSGRPPELPGVESMVGLFINTIPVRVRFDPSDTATSVLSRVQAEQADLLGDHYQGLSQIHGAVGAGVEFDTLLVFESYPVDTAGIAAANSIDGMSVTGVDMTTITHYPLTLLAVVGERLEFTFQYLSDVFDVATVAAFGVKITRILDAIVDDPTTVVGDIELLDAAERDLVLTGFNDTARSVDADATVIDLFEAQAAATPDAVAVTFGDQSLTYVEFASRVHRLARFLVAEGVSAESLVALGMRRSIDMLVGMYAVLAAGGAYVPLDPDHPAERTEHVLETAAPVCVLTTDADGLAARVDVPVFAIDTQDLTGYSDEPIGAAERLSASTPDNTAYVIFTSGSTGRPKGVAVRTGSVVNQLEWITAEYGIGPDDVVLQKTPTTFDVSVWELFGTLIRGGRLVIAAPDGHRDPDYLAGVIAREQVTMTSFVPSMLSVFAANVAARDVASLRTVLIAGEALTASTVAQLRAVSTASAHNLYGPTEFTVHATHYTADGTETGAIPIGGAVWNARALVLDERLHPAPVGVAGELYMAGTQLARGYFGRADLTSDRFVADPFGEPGARMYRTGDLVRWDDKGNLEYLGRTDFQVKVRGLRIELGEIESVLSRQDTVRQAAVIVVSDSTVGDQLVGYVVPAGGAAVDTETLTRAIGRELPSYMVPATIVVLDSMPLNPSGKLDRKALPAPVFASAAAFRAPTTPTEQTIAEVFAEVLGVQRVGVNDSFFALGGDSIVSIQVVSRAKARGVVFSPRDVFEQRTVAGLAAVATAGDAGRPAELVELPGGGVGGMPLTPVVRYMVDRGTFDRFNQTLSLELPAGIDRAGVVSTISAVVDHHDALRSRLFTDTVGVWHLETRPAGDVDVDALVHRVEIDSAETDLVEAATSATEAALTRLDPATGSVLQFVWLDPKDNADTGRLIVVAHHLVVDGVSWRILVPDFVSAWAQHNSGATPSLSAVGTSWRRWAHALADVATEDERRAELPIWKQVVAGADPELGSRAFDPAIDVASTVRTVSVSLDAQATDALLTSVPEAFHGGVNDALLAGLALALAKWRNNRGVDASSALVRMEGHGREEGVAPGADLSRTVGWFTSVYPVRLDVAGLDLDDALAGGVAAGAAVKAIKEQLRRLPDNGIGYGLLRYLNAETEAQLPHRVPGQIGFNYLGRISAGDLPEGIEALGWLPASDLGDLPAPPDPSMPAMAVVDINAVVVGGQLSASFAYPETLLDEAAVTEFAHLWRTALESIVAATQQPGAGGLTPSDLPLVPTRQSDIELWEKRFPALTDVWPLTPLQSGFMFHSILAEASVDVYTSQVVLSLTGSVDATRLHAAGEAVLSRYANLRTAFIPDSSGAAVQIVLDSVQLPWREVDLSGSSDAAFEQLLVDDRTERFDLARPPLIRFVLVTLGEGDYRLVVTNHHILLDGWSMPLLMKDLLVLYATSGDASVLPVVRPYRSYLGWLAGHDEAASIQAWRTALDGVAEPTTVSPVAPRREITALSGEYTFELSSETTAALATYAADRGVTVNTVVQVVWGILLGRLTGRDDVVFGTTVSGRSPDVPGIESMIGLFINTVPVRVRFEQSDSAASVLSRIQAEQSDLLTHHHVGLPQIHDAVGVGAEFDTLLVYESYPVDTAGIAAANSIDGMSVTGVDMTTVTHYPLTLLAVLGDRLEFTFQYLVDLFGRTEVETLGLRLIRIVEAIVADPTVAVGDIDILDAAERRRVVTELNATAHAVEADATVVSLFEAQAAATPDAPAVTSGAESLTYGEFAARVNRLARHLISIGVGPESLVALGMRRSVDLQVSMYAVQAAGGGYVPLDPDHPAERIAHVLDTAAPVCVLTADGFDVPGDVLTVPIESIDTTGLSGAPITENERLGALTPANVAYVLFTSGSTGRPKGVAVSHRSVVNQLLWLSTEYGLGAQDVVLQKTPATFDVSVWELFGTLIRGGRLVIATPDGHRDPEYLAQVIASERVTMTSFVPSMLAVFVANVAAADVASLRTVLIAGEALPGSTVAALGRVSAASAHNLYGPTEFTVHATHYAVTDTTVASVPMGVPVWNAAALVLDARLRPVPVGVAGELYLAGSQLARSYHGRPDLTADRFVANPLDTDGGRMYRTGDLVRWNESGDLEYLGRTDFQVKLRGLRIELGEIEAALLRQSAVSQAVAVVHTDATIGDQLVAYVVGSSIDEARLITELSREVPSYMVPATVVVLDEMPLNASGKLDRKALPAPVFASAAAFRAPETAVEQAIADIFADVLGVERIGLDDSFFGIGGNSLLATHVAARVGAALDTRVPVRLLFEAPTVARLAAAVETHSGSGGRKELTAMPRPDRVPLSLAQQRMWFLNRFDTDSAAYNIPVAVRLSGDLDVAALQAAIGDLVERHEVLRTRYPAFDGEGFQQILGPSEVDVELAVESVDESAVIERIGALIAEGFDVSTAPPFRVALLRLADNEFVLVFVVHHISSDGVSMGPLTRDLMVAYAERTHGNQVDWPPLPVQYADYTLWQREVLGDESAADSLVSQQLDFWKGALAGLPEQLDLPSYRPRPATASNVGGTVAFSIDADLHRKLDDLARRENSTLFMVVHAALAVLLARLSGTRDIAIGTPIAGRGEAALDGVIGMFVNTLVLRTEVDLAVSFERLVGAVRETDVAAFGHADVPFEKVVEVLDPERSPARHPLFQVVLAFQNMASQALDLPGLSVAGIDFDVPVSKFDLQLTLSELGAGAGLSAVFTYATDLFDEATVRTFAERFTAIVDAIAATPDVAVGDIGVLGDGESDAILARSLTSGATSTDVTLLDVIHDRIDSNGSGTAVRFDGVSTSYDELGRRANKLARKLIAAGAGPETLVAVAMGRSADLIVALLAVLETGAGYLPLDVTYPAERLEFILDDAAPAVVLTRSDERDRLPQHTIATIDVDVDDEVHVDSAVQAESRIVDADRLAPLRPEHTAYVIYTSGSTGRPKGVAVEHRNVVQLITNTQPSFGFTEDDVWTMFHSFAFDFSVWEIWAALATGGTVVVVDYLTSRAPDEVVELLAREKVTVLSQTPSAFYQLAEADRARGRSTAGRDDLSLRFVVFGGEALDLRQLTRWYERHPESPRLVNMYGITETTVHVSFLELDRISAAQASASVIGVGLPGLGVYVLDERLRPVPVGVPGEMYVTGAQLSRGYIGRPDLSAGRFVANPFGPSGTRMYRTGDVAKWNVDGQLEYAGRSDQQVQLRGFRIELGEVESALLRFDGVAQAVASVVSDDYSGQRLIGYVVPESGLGIADVDRTELRDFVGGFLTGYMVPDVLVVLPALPLTPNGKLDRNALPSPEFVSDKVFQEPKTPIEQTVAEVYETLLGVDRVGSDDDFFALGGNSLAATRVVARVNEALDANLGVRDLFEASTVNGLAARVVRGSGSARRGPTRMDRPERVPLSIAQQRMWVLNQLDLESAAYNIPLAIELKGSLDVDALQHAVSDVIERHESLRTRYPAHEGVPYQEVLPQADVVSDLELDVVDAPDALPMIIELVTTGFDVTERVPLRAKLFRVATDDYIFALVVHHIAADGASMAPLARDMVAAYAARTAGAAPGWAPLEIQYADFTLWQRDVIGLDTDDDSIAAEQLRYWKKTLSGLPGLLELPSDRPRPAEPSLRGANVAFSIPDEVHGELIRIAHAHNASLFMVIQAGLAVLLARLSGRTDIAIGTPIAGRGERVLDDLVGMFVNTLALRSTIDPAATFGELLDQTRETDLSAFANADVPFERIVEELGATRSKSHHPLVQVVIAFQNLEAAQLELPGLTVSALDAGAMSAKFDLQLNVESMHNADGSTAQLDAVFTYALDLFDESTVAAFGRRLVRILGAVVADPDIKVGDIDIFDADEREQMLAAGAARTVAPTAPSSGTNLAQLLVAAVEDDPEAPAVAFGDDEMPYRDLDQRSSRLARVLIDRGCGPGTGVVVDFDRTIEGAVARWAVVKTGAAILVGGAGAGPAAALGVTSSDRSKASDLPWLIVDDASVEDEIAQQSPRPITYADRVSPTKGDDTAFVSGTGSLVTYEQLATVVERARSQLSVEYDSRTYYLGSPTSPALLLELILAGTVGATMVIDSQSDDADPEEVLAAEWVTHLIAEPGTLANIDPSGMDDLQSVVVVGADADSEIERWSSADLELHAVAGPFENWLDN